MLSLKLFNGRPIIIAFAHGSDDVLFDWLGRAAWTAWLSGTALWQRCMNIGCRDSLLMSIQRPSVDAAVDEMLMRMSRSLLLFVVSLASPLSSLQPRDRLLMTAMIGSPLKLEFHDADTDTDILAFMSASWNASFMPKLYRFDLLSISYIQQVNEPQSNNRRPHCTLLLRRITPCVTEPNVTKFLNDVETWLPK